MKALLVLFLSILITGLFLYSKLLPYRDRLHPRYRGVFNFFHGLFNPLLNGMKRFIKPFRVGIGLSVDMTQIVLLILFLILLNAIQ
ncbi:MAG: hypothetical protein ABW019_15615 [Chitinophagaceae bacterium]